MNRFLWQIVKWTFIGLLVRLTLMPFTMHGQDLLFINYFPMIFIKEGVWDPYGFISANFPHFLYTYYGPFLFIIMSIANFIILKLFSPSSLVTMLELSKTMLFKHFTTVDYVRAFSGMNLFRNLFLLKSPYLIFDFLIGFILLKLAAQEKAMASYKLWMLNIVLLHSAYAVGQFDVIAAFFIILSLFFAVKKRPFLSIISLSLGGATKVFPYLFVLPASLLLGDNWKKRLSLFLAGSAVTVILYMPFYLSSGNSIFGIFAQGRYYTGTLYLMLTGLFLAIYAMINLNAVIDSRKANSERELLFYFLAIGFLAYAANPISFRYFVYITPLLALFLPYNKKFALFTIAIILILAFIRMPTRAQQCGLLAPLDERFYTDVPALQEIVSRFIDIEICYKVGARILLLSFFAAAWWVWQIKRRGGVRWQAL